MEYYVLEKGVDTKRYLKDFCESITNGKSDETWTLDLSKAMLFNKYNPRKSEVTNDQWTVSFDKEERVRFVTKKCEVKIVR
jgi:hypothetical protein